MSFFTGIGWRIFEWSELSCFFTSMEIPTVSTSEFGTFFYKGIRALFLKCTRFICLKNILGYPSITTYMQEFVLGVLFIVLGLFFITRAIPFFLRDEDDLYGEYRTKYDFGRKDFKKYLAVRRTGFSILALGFLTAAMFFIF